MQSSPDAGKLDARAPWLVLCVGMRRGGSTLQSQLVSELLGAPRVQSTSPQAVRALLDDPAAGTSLHVLKCHEYVPGLEASVAGGEARVVHVFRDVRDVVASICTKYGTPPVAFIAGGMQALLREHEQWNSLRGIYTACYESMIADLPSEVGRLSVHLGVPVGAQEAARIAAEFSVDRQKSRIDAAFSSAESIAGHGDNAHDRDSLLHRNHIQSGEHGAYRRVLRRFELSALEWICRDWLLAHGYRPETTRAEQWLAYRWYGIRNRIHAWRNRAAARG